MKHLITLIILTISFQIKASKQLTIREKNELTKLLFKGINTNCSEIVDNVLGSGLPLDSTLISAAYQQEHKSLVTLIRLGAKPNTLGPFGENLLIISSFKFDENFRYILKNRKIFGITIDTSNKAGMTALMIATRYNQLKAMQEIIAAGASLNKKNHDGQTALHIAADGGNFEAIKILVEEGAKTSLEDNEGKTAADILQTDFHALNQSLLCTTKNWKNRPLFFSQKIFTNLKKCYEYLQTHSSKKSLRKIKSKKYLASSTISH